VATPLTLVFPALATRLAKRPMRVQSRATYDALARLDDAVLLRNEWTRRLAWHVVATMRRRGETRMSARGVLWLGAVVFAGVLGACEALRRSRVAASLLDHPSERGLHARPTPRVGGIAVAAGVLSSGALVAGESVTLRLILVGGAVLALVGLLDDLWS